MRDKMTKKISFLVILLTLLMSSCKDEKKSSSTVICLDGEWDIVNVMGLSTAKEEGDVYINFDKDGTMNGNASVNSFFGEYKLSDDSLRFINVGITRMMSDDMEIEEAVTAALDKSVTFNATDSTLTVYDKDKRELMQLRRK